MLKKIELNFKNPCDLVRITEKKTIRSLLLLQKREVKITKRRENHFLEWS